MKGEKKYQPKSLFQRILEEHANWLFQQGYYERALGNREQPGKLLERLQESFEMAIVQTLWKYRLEEFEIGTRGVFTAKKDPVDFLFHYQYDPHRTRLNLTKLSARLYEESIEYLIADNTRRLLPAADAVHAQLSAVIAAQLQEKLKGDNKQHRPGKSLH